MSFLKTYTCVLTVAFLSFRAGAEVVPINVSQIGEENGGSVHHSYFSNGHWRPLNCYKDLSPSEIDIRLLAATMSAEARSGGIVGMAHTGEVMVNRACNGNYGGYSISGVILMNLQFSVHNHDSIIRKDIWRFVDGNNVRNKDFRQYAQAAMPIARDLLSGWRTGNLNADVLHYANLDHCDPAWVLGKTPVLVDKANHSFFQGIR